MEKGRVVYEESNRWIRDSFVRREDREFTDRDRAVKGETFF